MGPELELVERPFIAQLEAMGWQYLAGTLDDPYATKRMAFTEVVQEAVLSRALCALNLRDGNPWLDEARINEAMAALTRIPKPRLLEVNQAATTLLLLGITVEGLPDWDGGRGQTIQYIDWDHPERNTFTVCSQYRVDCPPGYQTGKAFIVPDLVLLVNGIPLVVVECKSPGVPEPLADAVDQLRRYHNQRVADREVEDNEGNEALFATTQLLIATCGDEARVGTIGAAFDHYAPWKTVVPEREDHIATALGVTSLNEQQRLIAGMLKPARLLDIVRHYVLFMNIGGQVVKAVCRYQQYRAVQNALSRLRTGKTRQQDGEHDRRGGIIWHTQGSGKSLTMVFLVRCLRTDPRLRRFKVVVITDRTDLQQQLSATAELTGDVVELAESSAAFQTMVKRRGPALLFATIQKNRNADIDGEPGLRAEDLPAGIPRASEVWPSYAAVPGVLNDDESILVLVDEAHRTQAGDLHANLLAALPNCARIGFTGTPIIMGDKKRTHDIFGEYLDRYTIRESEADGATVPVLYEGRTAKGAIRDDADLDALFEDLFRERSRDEVEAIKAKYATTGQIIEAPQLIAAKARDMLRHYVAHILPNGYKAQVVAASRLAAVRYVAALEQARTDLLAEAEALPPEDRAIDDEALCARPAALRAVVQAWRNRELLAAIQMAAVISGSNNDDPAWKTWTDGAANKQRVKRFKKRLAIAQDEKSDPLAFLVVKSMLLTGFDAPIEGVMYLDRPIREAELLQAIARVNRTGYGKQVGIVVDYYGVAHHLREALAVYADQDIDGALASLKDAIPVLRDRHQRVVELFRARRLDGLDDIDACVQVLEDERLRAEFTVKLKQFLGSMDLVLPRPEALPYAGDAKRLAHIYARARNRYKDTPVLGKDVGAKVRKLIDDHVVCLGIDPKVPPIQLGDGDFNEHVAAQASDRAKASEMEHAIRHHIRKHLDEDPVLYQRLSERLQDLLARLGEKWDEVVAALRGLIDEMRAGDAGDRPQTTGLPERCVPFLRLLLKAGFGDEAPSAAQLVALHNFTIELVDLIAERADSPSFWEPHKLPAQEGLGAELFRLIRRCGIAGLASQAAALKDQLLELARANQRRLLEP